MMTKFAVVFDLDGTLIDTPRGIVETFTATLNSMNKKTCAADVIKGTIGLPLEKAFAQLLACELDAPEVLDAVKQYQSLFKEIVLPKAQELIFPGVVDGLTLLKSKGYLLAVATSKVFISAEMLLKAAELWNYFDLVVGADHVDHPKPHPEMGELVMKKLDTVATNTIMIGDTTHDMLMAKDSGMHSIGVTYGIHDREKLSSAMPTFVVDTFDHVVQHVYTIHQSLIT